MFRRIVSKKNRALLAELVRTDFKLRYQGSVLGYMWTILRPLFLFAILYLVFDKFLGLGRGVPHFPVYLLMGIVIWTFFDEMTSRSLTSIVGRGSLIRKIRIPRWMIIFSSSISALINVGINLVVLAAFMYLNEVDLRWTILLLPLVLIQVYILALGLALFLSAVYVKFRDISYIWEVITRAGFYATPIIYPISRIPDEFFQKLLLLNPMAQAIQDARYAVITPSTVTTRGILDGGWLMFIPYILTIMILVFGLWYFRKESKYFAENV